MTASGMVQGSWALAVAFFVVTGLWPLVSPDTFFDALVAFSPLTAAGPKPSEAWSTGLRIAGGHDARFRRRPLGFRNL